MTDTKPTTVRQLITRSDSHPALVVPESGASLSYAALAAANGPALVVAFLAVAARGAAAAPLNPALGVAELTAELDDLRTSRLHIDGRPGDPLEAAGDPDGR